MNFEQRLVKKIKLPPTFGTDQKGKPPVRSTTAVDAVERDPDGNVHVVGTEKGIVTIANLSTDTRYELGESSNNQRLSSAAIIGFLPDGKPLTRLSLWSDKNDVDDLQLSDTEDPQSEDQLLHGAKKLTPHHSKHIVYALDHDRFTWAAIERYENEYFNVVRDMKYAISADPVTFELSRMNRALVHLPNGGIVAATTTHFHDGHSEHALRIVPQSATGQSATVQCGEMQTLDLVHHGDRVIAVFTEGTRICIMPIPLKDLEAGIKNGTLFSGSETSPEDAIRVIPNMHFSWYRGHLTRLTDTQFAFVMTTAKGTGVHVSWQIWSPDGLTDGPPFDVVSRIFTVNGEARYYGIRGHELYEMRLH